ncbi:hypothetical protein, partial [Klebsiella pneumoniae]|uniref:hypothetical protein n=1 Tax=Klebsiella pneumoniae TaxID=573 RepID=UPI00210BBD83
LMGLNYLVKDALVGVILVVALALSFWQALRGHLSGQTLVDNVMNDFESVELS